MRTLVLHRRFDRDRSEVDFLAALQSVADVREWSSPVRASGYDAVVVMVAFRDLVVSDPIDWAGFDGLRVLLDHDAYLNYWAMSERAPYLGAWPGAIRRHRFDLLLASGRELTARFVGEGVPAAWLPKGYDPARFHDAGGDRTGLVHYGSPYRARAVMLREAARAGLEVEQIQVPYSALPARLNRAAGCLICNRSARVPFGKLGRAVNRVRPLVRLGPSTEPMLKNFEAAAAGCAVFADWHPDLLELGFVDGENVVIYRTFDELVERARVLADQPDAMRRIGRAAATLARERHTWPRRARELDQILVSHMAGR